MVWLCRDPIIAIAIFAATIVAIITIVWATPAEAQLAPISRRDKAPILLDGRVLFQVSSVADFPAAERAATINEILEEQLQFGEPTSAIVLEREGQTTLSINDVHLLTVTLEDVKRRFGVWSEGEKKTWLQKQAERWGKRINAALQRAQKERSIAYIRQAALWSVGIVAVSIALSWALTWVRRTLLLPRLQASTSTAQFKQQQRWRLALTGVQLGIWMTAVYSIMGLFPILRRGRYALFASLTRPIFKLGEVDGSIFDLFILLAFIVGLWFVVKGFTHFLKTQILSLAGVDRGGQNTIGLLTQYGLVALGLLVFFTSWGIDIDS
ncbi:hypothetical protein IQ235_10250, partial [Oscillatoriales cyanobacterium LEGE 11467]|nr:hypothetical protein [Zarconia navalis LEGE 11467]